MPGHRGSPPPLRLLVAEDDHLLREILIEGLAADNLQIDSVADGDHLLATVTKCPPDLLITDIDLPGHGGLDAVEFLRSLEDGVTRHVMVVSARAGLETRLEAFARGTDDFVAKPFSIEELRARIAVGLRRLRTSQELERSREMMIRSEKMATIGALAAGVAHEFNNIMSGIAGFAQLARKDEKHRDRLVEIALEQAQRCQRITSSLCTFAGSASRRVSRGSLPDIVDAALCLLSKPISERQITVERLFDGHLPAVEVNLGQIQQLMVHLLLNAQQAVPQNGHIEIRVGQVEDRMVIEVDDDGPGIEAGDEVRIFDPFFSTRLGGDGEPEGSGLGLTFSLNVVESHRGTLTLVPSRLGGACFRVTLPLVAASPSIATEVIGDSPGREIVVVEDDSLVQEVVREALGSDHASCFRSGPEAVAHCRERKPDAVLLDLGLEGPWDGWRVLEELRRLASPPPVLLMTGQIDIDTTRVPLGSRVSVLYKPFGLVELERSLSNLLAGTR